MLVMLVPAFAPMAMPCAALPAAMHCMRHAASAQPVQSEMPCHHATTQPKPPQSESSLTTSEPALQSANDGDCCQKHCCCGATTSEWAQPASNLLYRLSFLIEPARASQNAVLHATDISRNDSARAPPRS